MKEMKKIKVEFTDETIFEGKDTTKVFIKTLKKIGLDRVKNLNLKPCKVPLISSEKTVTNENNRKYFYTKCDDSNYIMCHTNTEAKYRLLKTIKNNTSMIKSISLIDNSIIDLSIQPIKETVLTQSVMDNQNEESKEMVDTYQFLRVDESDTNWEKITDNITNVRRMSDPDDKKYVHENQIKTAKNGVASFLQGYRWLLLIAPMQSGKSGAYLSIAYIISKNKDYLNTLGVSKTNDQINMYVLTGMSDRELLNQFREDLNIVDSDMGDRVIGNDAMNKFLKPMSKWDKKMKETFLNIKSNSLIFIDESHFGSSNDQVLNKFLELLGIKQDGNLEPLIEKNIRVVSISATPYAEHLSKNTSINSKKTIKLIPGRGYYGLSDMEKDGKLRQAKDLNNEDEVKSLLNDIQSIDKNGYVLIRATEEKRIKVINIINKFGYNFDCQVYDSSSKKDYSKIDDIISKQPSKKTIIFIKGMLRAGKDMKNGKLNIILVHETSESQSDTSAQGLPGRVCGYKDNRDILVYCDLEQINHWIDWNQNDFNILNPGAKGKDVVSSGTDNIRIVPIGIFKTSEVNALKEFWNLHDVSGVDNERLEYFKKYISLNKIEIDTEKLKRYNIQSNISIIDSNVIPGKFFTSDNKAYIDGRNLVVANGILNGSETRVSTNLNKYIISPVFNKITNQVEFGIGVFIQDRKQIEVSSKTGY